MNTKLKLLLAVIAALLCGAGAYIWGTSSTEAYLSFQSPLRGKQIQTGEPFQDMATRRLVWVLIDGLRYDTASNAEVMPVLNQLRSTGAQARINSRPPSYSQPGYATILTGAWPGVNDGPLFNANTEEITELSMDTVFGAAQRSQIITAVSAYNWFDIMLPDSDVDLGFYTAGDDAAADEDVMRAALPWLANGEAQFVLIHLDQVDYAGHHEGGALSAGWDAAARRTDDMLGQMLAELDLSQDTIMVFSDHGHIDAGGHGGHDAVVLVEPLVAAGKGIRPGDYGEINMVDLAPTSAVLLGAGLPAGSQGQPVTRMLELSPAVEQAVPAALQAQQSRLLTAYAAAIGQNLPAEYAAEAQTADEQQVLESLRTRRLTGERVVRAGLALLLLAGCGWMLLRLPGKRLFWFLAGISLYLLAFAVRYSLLDGRVYSYSGVANPDELILYTATTAAVCAVLGWGAAAVGLRSLRLPRWESAWLSASYGLTLILFVSLPAVLNFVMNGMMVRWTAPDIAVDFLGLLGLIQIMAISGLTLVLGLVSFVLSRPPQK